METIKATIPSFVTHPDNGGIVKGPNTSGDCPKECIFLELQGGGRFACMLTESLTFAVGAVMANRKFMQQVHRWPGPGAIECPAGVGFDGEKLYLNPEKINPE